MDEKQNYKDYGKPGNKQDIMLSQSKFEDYHPQSEMAFNMNVINFEVFDF